MAVGFYVDMYRCVGCKACQVACKDKNRLEVGTNFRTVQTYSVGAFPHVACYSFSQTCNHCESPACLNACKAGAIRKAPDGTVLLDQDACVGCKRCVLACPYGHPKFIASLGVVGKCDGCAGLRQAGQLPACVAACPTRALDFGEMDALRKKYGSNLSEGSLAVLPNPSITHPHILVHAKASAADAGYRLVNW